MVEDPSSERMMMFDKIYDGLTVVFRDVLRLTDPTESWLLIMEIFLRRMVRILLAALHLLSLLRPLYFDFLNVSLILAALLGSSRCTCESTFSRINGLAGSTFIAASLRAILCRMEGRQSLMEFKKVIVSKELNVEFIRNFNQLLAISAVA